MLQALTLAAALAGPPPDRFFDRHDIEFWGPRPPKRIGSPPAEEASDLPAPVRELLADPTADRARAYLAWQRARLERIRKALELVERASKEKRND